MIRGVRALQVILVQSSQEQQIWTLDGKLLMRSVIKNSSKTANTERNKKTKKTNSKD